MSQSEKMNLSPPSTPTPDDIACLQALDKKVHWLSAWTIHHANHLRPKRDGLKVGGHQASSASLATVMSALYFHVLTPQDRVAVKPHASPAFHAIQYLLGNQTEEQLRKFRALGGAQSYPSRTKDKDDVDFSTGSVGLGVAVTVFASLAQDYLLARGWLEQKNRGRIIALLGDAELDEGNIYEALIEGYKQDLRNVWWIIDYNRQSLDAVTPDRMFGRFEDIFRTSGWAVTTIKYGKQQERAFAKPGGEALREWIDDCPNSLYSALTVKGGPAWRERLRKDKGEVPGFTELLDSYDDDALHALMINLGGHDMERLLETFHSVKDDRPHCFIAYTTKGIGMPFQGHKDNHAGLMSEEQMAEYQRRMGVPEGKEWEPFAGIEDMRPTIERFLARTPLQASYERGSAWFGNGPDGRTSRRRHNAARIPVPEAEELPVARGETQATQVAFGRMLHYLARGTTPLAERIVTTSPDVTVTTNLSGWVNYRGVFHRQTREDVFHQQNIVSMQKWEMSDKGQHWELGIAENNLFLALAALGLTDTLFGQRLLPIGTLYDPFIARGLDSLNYACYQDARFILVGTPSGVTLAPEGGAHQSTYTPLIGMGQNKLVYFEPAYVDELAEILRWALSFIQEENGCSVYIRLSTRAIPQVSLPGTPQWRKELLRGAYWQHAPAKGARVALVYAGVVAPEAQAAFQQLLEDVPDAGLLSVISPDRLHTDWAQSLRARPFYGPGLRSHIERLLRPLAPDATLVTVLDGASETLSWLGSVCGHRVIPLGVDRFGQSGDIDSLYGVYGIDTESIVAACDTARQRLDSK
uniref:Pyruvate dehydrogenase E1 component n=1 Tax=Candidatus Kentrum sp. MB TaxID=2138164 RepID=A0A450XD72_9GAMM|nr:MAG: pyruvate dehydrogenase E1 component [Candidatus Kentron sp. MB]VFK31073.1 MAG: pyruvate dehydrogenase E1 component [Candidatus Kentron sp. MB]VFK75507.1 MAG: pyruvate dehydrogenase E1 component [Candidatus Kentron sp. MB]